MGLLDIIILIILLISIFKGYKNGLAVEVLGFASVFIAGFAAFYLAAPFADFIKDDFTYKHELIFVAVFIVVVLCVSYVAKVLSNLFTAIGLGLVNHLGGAIVSLLKYVVILSCVLSVFISINKNFSFISEENLEDTILYEPMAKVSEAIFPYYKEAKKGINSIKEEYFD